MKYQYYNKDIKTASDLEPNEIFVFGSNLIGRHGAGAAKLARNCFGAKEGIGYAFAGMSYAIPTKDDKIITLPISHIKEYVRLFKIHSTQQDDLLFFVTKVGCGLAGYNDHDIAPLFRGSPSNCKFHEDWKKYLE